MAAYHKTENYATKRQWKKNVKNGCFFEKKSSVYAGLRLGAIYSTLLENDIETYRHPDKKGTLGSGCY